MQPAIINPPPEEKLEAEKKEETQAEMLDMFASESPDEFIPAQICPVPEACDDAEGYYKISIGDTIKNYKITSVAGRGVFGTVVKAIIEDSSREVAIKIVRNREEYRVSGEKERTVLQQLNDADVNSKIRIFTEIR